MDAGARGDFGIDEKALSARWGRTAEAMEILSGARSLAEITEALRIYARRIVGADGITVVLRDGDFCHYVAEDAIEPLWAGQKFDWKTCISGWAMHNAATVVIPDIRIDPRVPQEAYRATFVRSMVMVPIGRGRPVAAVGAYWSEVGGPTASQVNLLETLARAASTALENGRLLSSLEELNSQLDQRVRERTAELERSQDTLRQVQKMEIVGQLTGHVAHDFNNLLSPIIAGLDVVLAGDASAESIGRRASVAMQAAESAQTLVQRLLAFARRQPLAPTQVDIAALLNDMQALLDSTLGPRLELAIQLDPALPLVHADRNQLELALLNLAVNGRDAMPDGGVLTISAQALDRHPMDKADLPEAFVRLTVSDNGTGMDEATRRKAVEPFFTTKPAGHGTGLGLSMVHGFAGQSGGKLEIASRQGKGTSVTLWLPALKDAVEAEPEMTVEEEVEASTGKALLIDDNLLVRRSTHEMLLDLGYEIVDVDMAEQGLALIEEGYRPDIVVTDHIMPGMTGAELAVRLRADHPDIALLIISGYEGVDLIAPDVVRLSKPFRMKHLQASLAAAHAQAA